MKRSATTGSAPSHGARRQRLRASLTAREWRRVGLLATAIIGLHVAGFGILLGLVVPGGVFGLGVGITAYTLGLRHAFDADHIAAIDNTTRKLMSEGQRPLSVGFWFSLGHCTIVFALGLLVTVGVRGLGGAVADDTSTLHRAGGLVGPAVSGTFLVLIGILNLIILVSIMGIFRGLRHGTLDEHELERCLERRGFMTRLYARATRAVRKPWQMYPLGLLFGLGFDTATEVALLVLAGGAAARGLPFYAILCLPILFAAGMTLLDTLDGAFMSFAYSWAFATPIRKVFYNLTVTSLSVAVALLIGTIELLSVLAAKLDLSGGLWDLLAHLDLNLIGYGVVALFVAIWAIAAAIWHFAHVEERWKADASRL